MVLTGAWCRWVTPVVMTLYLLSANVLIINLLIAVFNNIYIQGGAPDDTLLLACFFLHVELKGVSHEF